MAKALIEVDGKSYLDGLCNITIIDSDFTIGVGDESRSEYFAYVFVDGDTAEGFWNGPEANAHAHTPLGRLVRDGDCWVNERARVCVYG